jgi:hypothetical protein
LIIKSDRGGMRSQSDQINGNLYRFQALRRQMSYQISNHLRFKSQSFQIFITFKQPDFDQTLDSLPKELFLAVEWVARSVQKVPPSGTGHAFEDELRYKA